jgi:hypothetical protein
MTEEAVTGRRSEQGSNSRMGQMVADRECLNSEGIVIVKGRSTGRKHAGKGGKGSVAKIPGFGEDQSPSRRSGVVGQSGGGEAIRDSHGSPTNSA